MGQLVKSITTKTNKKKKKDRHGITGENRKTWESTQVKKRQERKK